MGGRRSRCSARLRILSCYQIPYAGDVVFGWTPTNAYASLLAATESGLVEIKASPQTHIRRWRSRRKRRPAHLGSTWFATPIPMVVVVHGQADKEERSAPLTLRRIE